MSETKLFDGRPIYLFGCNDHSEEFSRAIDVAGFIDDFRAEPTFAGLPVLHGDRVPPEAIVVNCVLMAKGRMARTRAQALACADVYDYSDVLREFPEVVPVPGFVRETSADLKDHDAKWDELREMLGDNESRKTLDHLLRYRTSADLDVLKDYQWAPEKQYFDDVVQLGTDEVFVDCGGFDGDTTEEFIRRCPAHKRVYLFEPSESNMANAKKRLAGKPTIEFIQKGVSDQEGTASFDASGGSASAISEEGPDQIVLTTIDAEIAEKVSFIKMDLEGWEPKALAGAKGHILRDHPKLAIAVYHSPSDFWRIPELVLGFRDDYQLYLRHYTEGWVETIMYFIPR